MGHVSNACHIFARAQCSDAAYSEVSKRWKHVNMVKLDQLGQLGLHSMFKPACNGLNPARETCGALKVGANIMDCASHFTDQNTVSFR